MSIGDDPRLADVTAGDIERAESATDRHVDSLDSANVATGPTAPDHAARPVPGPADAEASTAGGAKRNRKDSRRRPRRGADAKRARPPGGDDGPFYAALDLGTNNCRLLVAAPRTRGFRVVDAFSRIVRLGEGISESGRLAEGAIERSIAALRICKAKLAERDVKRARLIATEACRAAENGEEFVERVRAETGLSLEIVSQRAEARLAVAGCASLVDQSADGVLLFDIGGGSSELVWIDLRPRADGRRRRMADRIRAWKSLPVGVVTLSEKYGGRHVDADLFERMVADVSDMLTGFPDVAALDASFAGGGLHMLGTSGTVTTLAGVHLGLRRYDRRRVDGVWLSGSDVMDLSSRIVAMEYGERVSDPCIGRDRADLVISGCAILEAIYRRWPCERLRVADRGLREGVLVELMARDGVWRTRRRRGGRKHG